MGQPHGLGRRRVFSALGFARIHARPAWHSACVEAPRARGLITNEAIDMEKSQEHVSKLVSPGGCGCG